MKTIKFRGVTSDGEVITSCGVRFDDDSPRLLVKDGSPAWQKVSSSSVVQLIGIDKNGNEIYEGDEIKSRFGSSCYANFYHYGGIIDGAYTFVQTRIIN